MSFRKRGFQPAKKQNSYFKMNDYLCRNNFIDTMLAGYWVQLANAEKAKTGVWSKVETKPIVSKTPIRKEHYLYFLKIPPQV